jgi:hypothetical protein
MEASVDTSSLRSPERVPVVLLRPALRQPKRAK